MTAPSLTGMILDDLWRRRKLLGGGAMGIALSIGLTAFLVALGYGLRSTVVTSMFPLDRLEVAPRPLALGLWMLKVDIGSDVLRPGQLAQLAEIPGVTAVYPRAVLTVPGTVNVGGGILGGGFRTEVVADGLPAAAFTGDLGKDVPFGDPGEVADDTVACEVDSDCAATYWCRKEQLRGTGTCRATIPVVVSRQLGELYNTVLRRTFKLPRLDLDAVTGLGLQVRFGESWTGRRSDLAPRVTERLRFAGYSELAIPLGVTMPLATVQRLNARYAGEREGEAIHGAVLALASPHQAAAVMTAVEGFGLEVGDRGVRRAARLLAVLIAVLLVIGSIVLVVAALGISHLFALIVVVRRRELGVWRVVGARPWQVTAVLAFQGALVGGLAGTAGVLGARLAAIVTDACLTRWLPSLELLPASLFDGWLWILPAGAAAAAVATAIGAAVPTLGVARAMPADLIRE